MARGDLIAVAAVLLFAAFLAGFLAHWAVARLTRPGNAAPKADPPVAAPSTSEDLDGPDRDLAEARADAKAARDALQIARMEADELREHLKERRDGSG